MTGPLVPQQPDFCRQLRAPRRRGVWLGFPSLPVTFGPITERYGAPGATEFIDLGREIFHRTQTRRNRPPMIVSAWNDHSDKRIAGNTVFSAKALSIAFSDHCGTHVDAPVHFDPRPGAPSIDEVPLENFYTEAICLDLSHVPLKHAITVLIDMAPMIGCSAGLAIGTISRALPWKRCTGSQTRAFSCAASRRSAQHRRASRISSLTWPVPSAASPIWNLSPISIRSLAEAGSGSSAFH